MTAYEIGPDISVVDHVWIAVFPFRDGNHQSLVFFFRVLYSRSVLYHCSCIICKHRNHHSVARPVKIFKKNHQFHDMIYTFQKPWTQSYVIPSNSTSWENQWPWRISAKDKGRVSRPSGAVAPTARDRVAIEPEKMERLGRPMHLGKSSFLCFSLYKKAKEELVWHWKIPFWTFLDTSH